MTYYLLEDPTLFIFLGIVIEAVLGIVLFRTGRGILLWIMLGVLFVSLTCIIGQRFIITERKRVIQTLDGIVAALENNELNGVLAYIEPDAVHPRDGARMASNLVVINSARYSSLDVEINQLTSPPTANLSFNGLINFHLRRGESPYENYPAKFTLTMRKHGDRWLVEDYSEDNQRR